MQKSINRKGGQALRDSPVDYFSEGARLQGWISQSTQRHDVPESA